MQVPGQLLPAKSISEGNNFLLKAFTQAITLYFQLKAFTQAIIFRN